MHVFMTNWFTFQKVTFNMEPLLQKKKFIHVHRLIKMKAHLHHSHITGKIIGYSHGFCNATVVEKPSPDILVITHNFLASIYINP